MAREEKRREDLSLWIVTGDCVEEIGLVEAKMEENQVQRTSREGDEEARACVRARVRARARAKAKEGFKGLRVQGLEMGEA